MTDPSPTTREVIERAIAELERLKPWNTKAVRDALQALLDGGLEEDRLREALLKSGEQRSNELAYSQQAIKASAEQMRERCAKEVWKSIESNPWEGCRYRILALPLREGT